MTNQEIIKRTVEYCKVLPKEKFVKEEIDFCKAIQKQRIEYRKKWNITHLTCQEIENSKISRWHNDEDLWWGLLCELAVVRQYGSKELFKQWAEDQRRQNNQILTNGHFDSKDIGHTQIRAAEWSEESPRRMIYRQKDFYTKSCQPCVFCLINTDEKDLHAYICGFFSWEDLKNRRQEFWCDPDNRGYPGMFVPVWELTSMDKFDVEWLK